MNKKKNREKKAIDFDVLQQIQPDAAGIDVGASELYVCVPPGRDEEQIRCFSTFTVDLHSLADWLVKCNIKTVAMESTGIYWIPLYDILEERGIEVYLVNARHLKNVSGRKSDVSDCQWLYQLHTYGLLRSSFHPADEIRALRALARHRDMLIRYRAGHIQHMQKALELMNVKLTRVLSDITGETGMGIIRAILAGTMDPETLLQYRHKGCKYGDEDFVKALTGNYRREHLFTLQQAVDLYDTYGKQIAAVDREMESMYAQMQPATAVEEVPTTPPQPNQRKRRKNQAHFDLATRLYQMTGVDLTQIDGIDALTAQTILTEIGIEVSRWRTEKHFTSWLAVSPDNDITGGKVKRRHTKKTNNRAATALRVAAQSLARSQSALGAFYRRLKARHGAPKAIVATAHKLARIIYHMLKNRVDYKDRGADYYNKQHKEQAIKRLEKQAKRLGLRLEPAEAALV
jgi:transposase